MQTENLLSNVFGSNAGKNTAHFIEQQQAQNGVERNEQQHIVSQGVPFYVERLEHATGMASMLDFVSHHIRRGSPLNVKDDIIFFDSILSSKFLMGRVRPHHYMHNDNESVKKFNPFLCCYFDFIAHTRWERAYVWQDHIYLLAPKMELNSYSVKQIPAYTVAIKVDDVSKFQRWYGETHLDIRKVVHQMRTETEMRDKNGNVIDLADLQNIDISSLTDSMIEELASITEHTNKIPIQMIEDSVVEQTIPLEFLNESNYHFIYSANRRKFAYQQQKMLELEGMSPEKRIGSHLMENQQLYQFFTIDTQNKKQRVYGDEEVDWAKRNNVDEVSLGWNEYRDKTTEELNKSEENQ